MRRVAIALAAVCACLVAVVAIGCGGGDDRDYHVRLVMKDAGGLRDGAEVAMGGVGIGRVDLRMADDRRSVIADLEIDPEHAPLDRDVRVAISAVNLLGLKRADIIPPARPGGPAPDGHVLKADRLTVSTDLDQVLAVLDPDTRTALAVVINEAGAALSGRRKEFARLVAAMPRGFSEAARLVDELVHDNRTLKDLVAKSDGFIREVTERRRELTRLVRTAGAAGTTVAARHAELRETLRRAPATLASLRGFLAELRGTASSLGPAARHIADTAPELSDTLAQVAPFERAAAPALRQAREVAPQLTQLGTKASPVVRRARTTAAELRTAANALIPVSATLDDSADNFIGILENWSRAIQFRDGLSHVFRGEATVSGDLLDSYVQRLISATDGKRKKRAKPRKERKAAPDARPQPAAPAPKEEPRKLLPLPQAVDKVLGAVNGVVKDVLDAVTRPKAPADRGERMPLLDFLLKP